MVKTGKRPDNNTVTGRISLSSFLDIIYLLFYLA